MATLFKDRNGRPFEFILRESIVEKSRIEDLIQVGGGRVVKKGTPHSIILAPPPVPYYGEECDAFVYQYVEECKAKNEILDLNLFRIGTCSKYKSFDANDVLCHRVRWDEVPLEEKEAEVENYTHDFYSSPCDQETENIKIENNEVSEDEDTHLEIHYSEDDTHIKSEDDIETKIDSSLESISPANKKMCLPVKANINRGPKSKRRREYRRSEQELILKYIIDIDGYPGVKGITLWKNMEKENVVEGRTWQSLKEHFLKKIYPNMRIYNLEEEVFMKFRHFMTKIS